MVFERQLSAFGGMVLVGSILFVHTDALAFGQHWRPAPGYGAAGSLNRVANMPSFRPSTTGRQSLHRPYIQLERRPYRPRSHRLSSQRFTGWQGYPLPHATNAYALGLHLPQPGYFAGANPGPGWGMPFAAMAGQWRQPLPLFARQYAWRPATQPWVARAPVYPRYDYRERTAPGFVEYGSAGPVYANPAGRWRPPVRQAPASRPQLSYQSHVAQPPHNPKRQRPGFHTVRPAVPPVSGNRVAGRNPMPGARGGGYWRPNVTAPVAARRSGWPFRPQEYGRSLAAEKEAPSRGSQDRGFARDGLPGWVTTYRDSGDGGSCDWCYGS
jgi:hypothetical protein